MILAISPAHIVLTAVICGQEAGGVFSRRAPSAPRHPGDCFALCRPPSPHLRLDRGTTSDEQQDGEGRCPGRRHWFPSTRTAWPRDANNGEMIAGQRGSTHQSRGTFPLPLRGLCRHPGQREKKAGARRQQSAALHCAESNTIAIACALLPLARRASSSLVSRREQKRRRRVAGIQHRLRQYGWQRKRAQRAGMCRRLAWHLQDCR